MKTWGIKFEDWKDLYLIEWEDERTQTLLQDWCDEKSNIVLIESNEDYRENFYRDWMGAFDDSLYEYESYI